MTRWTPAMKFVKKDRHVFRWYTTAVICHAYSYVAILLKCRQNNAPTIWCVLDGILHYVRQNTTKLFGISADWRNFKVGSETKIVSSLFGRSRFGFDYR